MRPFLPATLLICAALVCLMGGRLLENPWAVGGALFALVGGALFAAAVCLDSLRERH